MMRINLLLTLLSVSLYGYSQFQQLQGKNFIDQPYIETSVSVDTLVKPDMIYLAILIAEKDVKGKISVEEYENKMADKLNEIGINIEKQLSLSDLSSNFKNYFIKQQDIHKSKAYSLIIYDAQTAGRVIAGLEEIGISNVNIEKTKYSRIEIIKLELRSKAVLKAQLQCLAMLKPLNQKLGKAIFISDNRTQVVHTQEISAKLSLSSKNNNDLNPLDIEFKKIEVQSTVGVKFIIE